MQNRLEIIKNKIEIKTGEEIQIEYNNELKDVLHVIITVSKDSSLVLNYDNQTISKIDIKINVLENVSFHLCEMMKEENVKIQYQYDILSGGDIQIHKFREAKEVRELDIIYLNGENASISYDFRGISLGKQKYNMVVYHNAKNTKSNISNKLVAMQEGEVHIDITSIVYPSIKGTSVHQNNRIINLNEKEHKISPNLLIEENDIEASHSAHIGGFDKDALFYLMSRGITKTEATKLLLNGFLTDNFPNQEQLSQIINQYWR